MRISHKTEISIRTYYYYYLGPHRIQPSAYNNVATYPLDKYKLAFRAVSVPEEMINMDTCTGKGV